MTTYPNEALTDVCKLLMDDYDLTLAEIADLAKDIFHECEMIAENRNEQAWEDYQNRDRDDSSYRTDIINAGRGHLLK